ANFSIATDEQWKDRNGARQKRTEWHNITSFGKLGEIAGQYLKTGSLVFIEGRIQSRKYQGKDGVEKIAYGIIANELKMLGNSSKETSSPPKNTVSQLSSNQYLAASTGSTAHQQYPVPASHLDDGPPF
ncbi:single-stranded DNA-binding protein, partial [Snodgrassella sp. CFCC 13594]|uniref:single-stranded DNA-binding protein n=1 Tax=Snodgrassella sp. CFCC 13594 TaxID=1775559 RepID=UPI0009ED7121